MSNKITYNLNIILNDNEVDMELGEKFKINDNLDHSNVFEKNKKDIINQFINHRDGVTLQAIKDYNAKVFITIWQNEDGVGHSWNISIFDDPFFGETKENTLKYVFVPNIKNKRLVDYKVESYKRGNIELCSLDFLIFGFKEKALTEFNQNWGLIRSLNSNKTYMLELKTHKKNNEEYWSWEIKDLPWQYKAKKLLKTLI